MKKLKKIKLESLNDSKFDALNCEQMTRLVGGGYDQTATVYPGGGGGADGDDSDWMNGCNNYHCR